MNYLTWGVAIIVAAFPALAILVHNAGNASLYLLTACGIAAAIRRSGPRQPSFLQFLKRYWPLHLAMAAWCLAVFLNQLSTGEFAGKHYDRAMRLAVFVPVAWAMLQLPFRYLKIAQWGAVAGVFAAATKAYMITSAGNERPPNIGFLSAIAYADIALFMGTIAILSLGWGKPRNPALILLKVAAFFAGIYTTLLTGVRGSWLAIPAVLAILFFFSRTINVRRKLLIALGFVAVLGISFSLSAGVQNRVRDAVSDITQFRDGTNPDTSIGMRLQMWHASWILFKERPVLGIGRENYPAGVKRLAAQGIISPAAAHFAHSHNELLFNLAIGGIVGMLVILGLYFVPAYYFSQAVHHPDHQVRTTAAMGITLCVCFLIFGMTDLMFFWSAIGSFYTMCTALFFTCLVRRREEIGEGTAMVG